MPLKELNPLHVIRYTYIIEIIGFKRYKGLFMRKIPITLTLPEHLVRDLHLYISQRGISNFVSGLVEKGLDEKRQILAKEFREASVDEERNSDIAEWDNLVGTDEGLDGSNNY